MTKTHLDAEHRLELQLANERIASERANANAAAAAVEIAELRAHILRVAISANYGLSAGDNMNFSTGEITRAPHAPEKPPEPPPLLAGQLARS